MSKKAIVTLSIIALVVSTLSAKVYLQNMSNMKETDNSNNITKDSNLSTHEYAKDVVKPKEGQPIKKFTLITEETKRQLNKVLVQDVWTFNGSVPGPEIRVTQGDFVEVTLKNFLKDPVTIHWHGYPLNSAMDGVPGLMQDAIREGESFTYKFSADIPGTYWYHSHQEGSKQVDKGLYGVLIVEPKDSEKVDKDLSLVLDEWIEDPMMKMESNNTNSDVNKASLGEENSMKEMYNIYTVNGKSGELIDPINVSVGDKIRLRFINAGYRSHGIHIPGQDIKVVSTDGQTIKGAQTIKDQTVLIAPGERYDIEFTVTKKENFYIDFHDDNKFNDQIKIPVIIAGSADPFLKESSSKIPLFDLTSYGDKSQGQFTFDQKYDASYNIDLGVKLKDNTLKYTINGETFDELPPLTLKTNEVVKLIYTNKSNVDHPMHLHGHFFQVISKNDRPLTGAPIIKDTLLIKPGESYTIAFKADNPGNWVEHCHELHHASAGMMQKIIYSDYKSNYTNNPNNTFNKPE